MFFQLLFLEVWDIIFLRHNLMAMYGMVCVFALAKTHALFSHAILCIEKVVSQQSGLRFSVRGFGCALFILEERKMFEEPGYKLKTVAKILCWLGIIGTVIAAVTLGKDRYGDFDLLSFLLILIIGCVTSYISSLVLYGFGEMIESTSSVLGHTSRILIKMERIEQSAELHSVNKSSSKSDQPNSSSLEKQNSAEQDLKRKGLIRCPECGTIQSIDRESCYCCGNKL